MSDPGENLFKTKDGHTRIDVRLVGETVWLSAGQISADAARVHAEQYETYRHSLDPQPSPVERHFDEAVKKAKQLAEPKKKTGEKRDSAK